MKRSKEEKKAENASKLEALKRDGWKYDVLRLTIGMASVPLLTPTSRGAALEPIASAVVTELRDRVFIFTAVHALKYLVEKPVFIPVRDGSLVQIEGHAVGKSEVDAAVFHVESKNLEPILDVAIPGGSVFVQNNVLNDNLILYGFPAREYTRDAKAGIVNCPPQMFQMKGLVAKAYKRHQRDPKDYVLINWPNKLFGPKGIVGSPDLKGMSGCGVWYHPLVNARPLSLHAADPMPRLVGIFIEQWRDKAMLIATNVHHHAEIVWRAYPELLERYRADMIRRIAERNDLEQAFPDQEFWRR